MNTLLKIWNLQLGQVLQSRGINHLVIHFRGWIIFTNSQHLRSTVLGLPCTISKRSRKSFKKLMKSNMTLRNKIGMSPTRRCEIRQTLMWLGSGRSKCASEAIVLWFVVQPRRLYRFPWILRPEIKDTKVSVALPKTGCSNALNDPSKTKILKQPYRVQRDVKQLAATVQSWRYEVLGLLFGANGPICLET